MGSRAESDGKTTAAGGELQSRRRFLRGLGACVALPAFASLAPSRLLAAGATAGAGLATTPTGAPLRAAFIFFPNGAIPSAWWPKADAAPYQSRTLQPLEPVKDFVQVLGRPESPNGRRRAGRAGRPCARQRHVPDRRPPEEERHRHPRRGLDRPGHRAPGRPPHAVPLARAGLRRGPQERGLRLRLFLRLPVQPRRGARRRRRCRRRPTRGSSSSGSSAPARTASGGRT